MAAANGKLASEAKSMPSEVFPELVVFSRDMIAESASDELKERT